MLTKSDLQSIESIVDRKTKPLGKKIDKVQRTLDSTMEEHLQLPQTSSL